MAQDRLWQMDLLRRAAAGDLSEIFGAVALEFDEDSRTLGMRQAAERAAGDASPEIRGMLEAYARRRERKHRPARKKTSRLSSRLGYSPRPWTPADTYLISLYMYETLTSTWKEKLNRQWITGEGGTGSRARIYSSRIRRSTISSGPQLPRPHNLIRGTVADVPAPGVRAAERRPAVRSAEWDAARDFLAQFDEQTRQIIGSNNFVVSGAHTASGKPLLANDTHLQLSVPALWYVIHLTRPGFERPRLCAARRAACNHRPQRPHRLGIHEQQRGRRGFVRRVIRSRRIRCSIVRMESCSPPKCATKPSTCARNPT